MIVDRLSLIGLFFLFLFSRIRASTNITEAQCALMDAQIHLAYMGTLLNSSIYDKSTLEKLGSQEALVNAIVTGLIEAGKNDNTKAIDKSFIDSYKTLEPTCKASTALPSKTNIADTITKYVLVALPSTFKVDKHEYKSGVYNKLDDDLKTAIANLL